MTDTLDENLVKQRMDKALISFQNDLNSIRAGRASINMLDQISVDVYGSKLPLNQLSNIILKYEDKLKGLDDMDPISEDDD